MNDPSNQDMPRPRRQSDPVYPGAGGLPPLKRADSTPKKPAPVQQDYASDTMSFAAVPPEEEWVDDGDDYEYDNSYDEAYERRLQKRRAARTGSRPAPEHRSEPVYRTAPERRTAPAPKKKPRRKKSSGVLGRLVRLAAVILAVVFYLYSAVALFLIGKMEKLPKGERTVTTGTLEAPYVHSVLLIGTDARDVTAERGRSDTMILLSVNSRSRTIYMTSFMRDSYVTIPGHGAAKLNAAYSYGGAELLMDTLEQNFNVSIDDYMCVSFSGFAGIIDSFGGVEMTLSDSEAQAVNEILQSEVNGLMGDDPMSDFLQGGGTYVLDGKQALSYARIRYVGNADFERTSRQREVMAQLLHRAKTRAVTAVPKLAASAMPQVGTNMSTGEAYLFSLRLPLAAGYQVQQIQIPADGTWSGATIDGQSVLQVDLAANQSLLSETVYSTQRPEEQK
ncbi:MAG: LCP family protein [Oscillospiraceae bacterium]|nr:LCP family protein [Oscillospiraceae bacterium]